MGSESELTKNEMIKLLDLVDEQCDKNDDIPYKEEIPQIDWQRIDASMKKKNCKDQYLSLLQDKRSDDTSAEMDLTQLERIINQSDVEKSTKQKAMELFLMMNSKLEGKKPN